MRLGVHQHFQELEPFARTEASTSGANTAINTLIDD